jgi:type IX secretion system PorP/SprF family membrane protein
MIRKVYRHIFCLSLMLLTIVVYAQQDPQLTQYMFNSIYVTPGAAGVDGVTRATALHRSQWQGYQSSFDDGGAPTTQLFTFTAPIFKLKRGFGAYALLDKSGPLNTFEFQGLYAYHLGIKENKLSIGL